ncbi:hypothetical protein D5F01_LYC19636 [Larimichthys crocea]|uniref:Murine leukemia virus integrase C-terminal domain-containing protein n=1 Tax=Larimichthys crocea TaxID=215358 RepID=A0A6G0HT24_LARCR|nr:hypothetical protein D5F01_LYC19636 [Larimichthys crocea]
MSDILEKLPTLQDGAHPWISKLEELMVGTHMAVGDIKKLLASLLGIAGMEELLQKAGLNRQRKEEVQDRLDEQERITVQPGDKVFVKVFRRKWYSERREGPFEVVRSTGTAVQVKGSPTWYHLSHCIKAPREEVQQARGQNDEGPGEGDHYVGEHADDRQMHEVSQSQNPERGTVQVREAGSDVDDALDGASNDDVDNGQGREFKDINFQHAPETSGHGTGESKPPENEKGFDSSPEDLRDQSRQRSPRPVRRKVKPLRYAD